VPQWADRLSEGTFIWESVFPLRPWAEIATIFLALLFLVVFAPGWLRLLGTAVKHHIQYYWNLSLESETQARWEGLTRRDLTKARNKAKHTMNKRAKALQHVRKPQQVNPTTYRGPRQRRERARRRAKKRGETLVDPPESRFDHLHRLMRHVSEATCKPARHR
jgi:hypothetical protein